MSIAQLQKVAVIGPAREKTQILTALHNWGKLHLCESLTPSDVADDSLDETLDRLRSLSERLKKSLHYLRGVNGGRTQVQVGHTRIDSQELLQLVDSVLDNQRAMEQQQDYIDGLKEREQALRPWGDFRFPEGEHIAGQRLWFYLVPNKLLSHLNDLKMPWQIVHQNHAQAWVILIAEAEPDTHLMPCERVHVGQFSLSEVVRQRQEAEIKLEDLQLQRIKLARFRAQLEVCQAQAEDIADFAQAQKQTQQRDGLCVVHGWIDETLRPSLQSLCASLGAVLYIRNVDNDDRPPTLLKNAEFFQGGELLVNFYQTPDYRSWDPALPLFGSFAIFFAMILSDAGYAALLGIGCLVFWRKFSASRTGRLLRPMLLVMISLALVWGVAVGSYFGVGPPTEFLANLKVLDIHNFNSMMTLSIGCGIAHLLFANVEQIVLYWGTRKARLHIGWVGVLIFATLMALDWQEKALLFQCGAGGMMGSALIIMINASDRPVHSVRALLWRLLEGLKELTNITGLFGDVLSYLRLFALGLASASLALTFNDLSDQVFRSDNGFGVIGGLLILVIGHLLNIFLGIVSGVVHGLRLNFIEFYKWALYGEGYPFKAFKKRELTHE